MKQNRIRKILGKVDKDWLITIKFDVIQDFDGRQFIVNW